MVVFLSPTTLSIKDVTMNYIEENVYLAHFGIAYASHLGRYYIYYQMLRTEK